MIGIRGSDFIDENGRVLMLRGVNLGGSSKVPRVPDGATHRREGFLDHRRVSFVGRPFPLQEADGHYRRLKEWGLTFLRFLVTWEAVEHEGPGRYDEEYLDYLRAVVRKAADHGISLFIDPHQDMWSRWSGGDGAPGWTLEAVGFDLANLDATGAALTHQMRGDPFPRMIWPTNSGKLAAATMFTLFFAGDAYAPGTLVEGEPVQGWLQRHYIAAMARVAERLADLPHVVGYDTMNEPLPGYVGWRDLNTRGGLLSLGDAPTAFQGMVLGAGIPRDVEVWRMRPTRLARVGVRRIDPAGRRAWREGFDCVWRRNGVWDLDASGKPALLRPRHFASCGGRDADFIADFYLPFADRFAAAVRAAHPGALVFLETDAGSAARHPKTACGAGMAFAPHWYDDLVVVKKFFLPFAGIEAGTLKFVLGRRAVRRSFARQLSRLKAAGMPTLLGEFGIPFDMHGGRAFRTGSFRRQEMALDRSMRALEDNLLSGTLWNYTADNSNARGDLWNGEDFSVFSRDQQRDPDDPDSGGRALAALLRPYPRATAGVPLRLSYDFRRRIFEYSFRHDPAAAGPTEIRLPRSAYPCGFSVAVSDGSWKEADGGGTLLYDHGGGREVHWVRVAPRARA